MTRYGGRQSFAEVHWRTAPWRTAAPLSSRAWRAPQPVRMPQAGIAERDAIASRTRACPPIRMRGRERQRSRLAPSIKWGHDVVVWNDPGRGGKVYKLIFNPSHSAPRSVISAAVRREKVSSMMRRDLCH
jgi:hypothetical protein